jgi:methylphosphotriester-DNA--protein-cysteine methyltransferase
MEREVVISRDKREDDRYHAATCRCLDDVRSANKQTVTLAEAQTQGYRACSDCRPGP